MNVVKTLKIVILPRSNSYFQEIRHKNQQKNKQTIDEKLYVFLDLDFVGIFNFWRVFGWVSGGQNLDFRYFSDDLLISISKLVFRG